MNARFLNDCSSYHAGSALVARELRRLCAETGIRLAGDAGPAELMLVNGEGSMHHSAPRALQILRQMEEVAPVMPVALLNTVWQKRWEGCATSPEARATEPTCRPRAGHEGRGAWL